MPTIQTPTPDQWELFREVRLNALRDTPNAFGSTLERERTHLEADWKNRLERTESKTFIAFSDDAKPVGLIVGAPYGEDAGLFAMWVDASERRKGIGGILVDAVIQWAKEIGYARILLDVADENAAAIALYQHKGFIETGVKGTLPAPRDHIKEHQRAFTIQSPDEATPP